MSNLFKALDHYAPVERKRRHLPHWEQSGGTYFVTFRTADSLPSAVLERLRLQKETWRRVRDGPWPAAEKRKYQRYFRNTVEKWLDRNLGTCPFKSRKLAQIVEKVLNHFDQDRYVLDEYSIMPNHVHGLVKPFAGFDLPGILHSWKSYTSQKINGMLGKSGNFWMEESFDRLVRSAEELEKYRIYIRQDPVKANLQKGEFILGTGSGLATGKEASSP